MLVSVCQTVDGDIVMICAHWEKRRGAVLELQEQLQQIPAFLSDLETITSRIGEPLSNSHHTIRVLFNDKSEIFVIREGGY